jgi:hypothetical protein
MIHKVYGERNETSCGGEAHCGWRWDGKTSGEGEEKVGAHILGRSIYLAETPDTHSVYLSIVLV